MQAVRFSKPVWVVAIAAVAVGTFAGVALTSSNGPSALTGAVVSASPSGQLIKPSSPATSSGSASSSASTSPSASQTGSGSASASTSASASAARSTEARADRAQLPVSTTSAAKRAAAPPLRSTPAPVKPAITTAPTVARPGGRPGPTNTGVPAGTALSVVNGDLVVTTPGAVIDAKHIKGALIIRASNVKVTRSLIDGRAGSDSVDIQSGSGILLQDDEVTVAQPSVTIDSMHVRGATLNRLNIHGGVDGMKLGSNSTVENCWIHGLQYFSSDPAQGGKPTHNDTIQIMSGSNIHIVGNYLQAIATNNAAVQITQDKGTTSGVYISGNWADGGGCTFNFSGHGPGGTLLPMSGISATNNRFGHNTKFAGCAILTDLQTTITQSGNVFDDTGAPVVVQRHN